MLLVLMDDFIGDIGVAVNFMEAFLLAERGHMSIYV